MPSTGIISQARMTSTRLPGKVLRTVAGDSLLRHHIRRLQTTGLPIYIATTTNATDDALVAEALACGAQVFRGDEHDVLARFLGCARTYGLDTVVRVTSDCPLIDPQLIVRGLTSYRTADSDAVYVSNCMRRTYPRGFDFEIFATRWLEKADRECSAMELREHVTPYLYRNLVGTLRQLDVVDTVDNSDLRLTVDTPEDFELIRVLIENYHADRLDHMAITHLLRQHPELVALNQMIAQKPH